MPDALSRLTAALAGRYSVDAELGVGGMATVYRAHDLKHDRAVAIKVLRADLASAVGADRFQREIQLAARLSHPHILPLFDSGGSGDTLFYVMPVVRGESLRDRLDRDQQLPVAEAVRIAREICSALDHAHREQIVHRDVKPENILLQDGHALLADFGIGKLLDDAPGQTLTHTGLGIGTPAYVSPEQAVGDTVDGRSDQYALGCVLYEMLVGEPPFTGPTVQAVITKRFVQTPADVEALRDGVSRSVARALQRALARTAFDRFPTLGAFAEALATPASESAPSAPPDSLAVLPFEVVGVDEERRWFGEGIADEITNALTRIDGLKLAGRTSAFSFKDQRADVRTIGQRLGVALVLEGTVRTSGNRIRVSTQLVSTTDGYRLWSERYDRDLADIFAVQDEIAEAVATRLARTLKPTTAPAALNAAELRAYEKVAEGRVLTARRGADVLRARPLFEEAIAIAPDYAPGYAALGEALRIIGAYDLDNPRELNALAEQALRRAITLDPSLAEAHGSLGAIMLAIHGDPEIAEQHFDAAFARNPALSEVRAFRGFWLDFLFRGDMEGGLRQIEQAVAEDPLAPYPTAVRVSALLAMERFEDAAAALPATTDGSSDPLAFLLARIWVPLFLGDPRTALTVAEQALRATGRAAFLLQVLPAVYRDLGDAERAEAAYQELRARSALMYVSPFSLSQAAAGAGHIDAAVHYAECAVRDSDTMRHLWRRGPFSRALREDARGRAVLQSMGVVLS